MSEKLVRLIIQGVVSLAGLAVGICMVIIVDDMAVKMAGSGFIGLVLGYWLR